MRVFLHKDVAKIGLAGEIIKVEDGFARNFLIPRKLASEVTQKNEDQFKNRLKVVEHRKEVIATQTSMLAEKIKNVRVKIRRKMHDDGKLYGAVNALEVVEALAKEGISISKSQVDFGKLIKSKGTFEVTIKLTSRLKPTLKVDVVSE